MFPITESGFSKEVLDRPSSLKACVFFSCTLSNTQPQIPIKKQFDLGSCLPSRLLDLQEESSCVREDLTVAVSCNGKNHCISGVCFQARGLVSSAIKTDFHGSALKVAVGVGGASGWERGKQRGTVPEQSKRWGDGSEILYSKSSLWGIFFITPHLFTFILDGVRGITLFETWRLKLPEVRTFRYDSKSLQTGVFQLSSWITGWSM